MHPGLKKFQDEQKAHALDEGLQVITYEGDMAAESGMRMMLANGWKVQSHNVRKQRYSRFTGVFTSTQIHTVTYVAAD